MISSHSYSRQPRFELAKLTAPFCRLVALHVERRPDPRTPPEPDRITPDKSLAPYRECRGGKSRAKTEQGSGRGTFDRGDLKEAASGVRPGGPTREARLYVHHG